MNARIMLPPLLAVGMLLVIWSQTSDALRRSGTWTPRRNPVATAADPYARLDGVLAEPDTGISGATLRDPFTFTRVAAAPRRPATSKPVSPSVSPRPVVTAIVMDAEEGRAIVWYEGKSFSVKQGDLFAQYRVVTINANQVIVEDGRDRLVLPRPTRGD
jgi:hypothetical protein